jgi:hypothetical protein
VKIYVTKYALTQGITTHEVGEEPGKGWPWFVTPGRGEGLDWHLSMADAMVRAYAMRDAKIASLKRAIAKLEGMEF